MESFGLGQHSCHKCSWWRVLVFPCSFDEWVWSGTGVSDFLHTSPVTWMHVQVWGGTASRERFYGLLCAGSPPSVPSLAGALPGCRTHAARGCGTSRTILTTPVHREASCHWFSFCDSSRVSLSGQLIYGRASCHVSCFGLETQLSWVSFLPS